MMPVGSVTAQNRRLDAVYGDNRGPQMPTYWYIAFFSADPRSTGVEPPAGGYARISVANTTAIWPAASGGQKSNAVELVTAASTGAWGTDCTWFGIMDASTGGNLGDCGQLSQTVSIPQQNYTARFQVGQLVLGVQ
jgi:hypothetical protein